MEKILIKENTIRHADALEEINETIQVINTEFRKILIEIGIDKISLSVLKDCLTNSANQVEKSYQQKVEKDLEKISTISIKKMLFRDAGHAFRSFRNQFEAIKPKLKHVDYLTIENDICILTQENKNKLFESLNTYISDPKEIEAYNRHQAAAEALTAFFRGTYPLYWHNLFVFENGEFQPNENTNYLSFINHGTVR